MNVDRMMGVLRGSLDNSLTGSACLSSCEMIWKSHVLAKNMLCC